MAPDGRLRRVNSRGDVLGFSGMCNHPDQVRQCGGALTTPRWCVTTSQMEAIRRLR